MRYKKLKTNGNLGPGSFTDNQWTYPNEHYKHRFQTSDEHVLYSGYLRFQIKSSRGYH